MRLPICWCCWGLLVFGVDVCIVGTAWMETSLVDEMFSLDTDSDLREIVPRLSLPLWMKINGQRENSIKTTAGATATNFLGIMKSSRKPNLVYRSHRFSFECSTLLVESRSNRIFRLRYFSRIDLKRRSASVAVVYGWCALRQIEWE